MHYWSLYSGPGTWQFWFNCFILIAPLTVLYVQLDRRKALLIGFYGFNVHIWFGLIDAFGSGRALWTYPYKIFPFLPISFALDVSLVPVVYMLVYQWTINHEKNYYLYATLTSAAFAFVLKPVFSVLQLFHLYRWMNYFYLFLGYVVVMLVSKLITDLFLHFEHDARNTRPGRTVQRFDHVRRGRGSRLRAK
ncbi:CBO0543 family protein [Alicyclobacillus fastidiosus]|uniref:CBO0543 family protein n=1 Tax=Alicyclobacillus fastidiosus TaxID=392011 RepID=A0ABV5AHL8_9BACL